MSIKLSMTEKTIKKKKRIYFRKNKKTKDKKDKTKITNKTKKKKTKRWNRWNSKKFYKITDK